MSEIKQIGRILKRLYPQRDEDKLRREFIEALEKTLRPGEDFPIYKHVRQVLAFADNVATERGTPFKHKIYYAHPLAVAKKLASLTETQKEPIEEAIFMAALLYPSFYIEREKDRKPQLDVILEHLPRVLKIFKTDEDQRDPATARKLESLAKHIKNILIEMLELSELYFRTTTTRATALPIDKDPQVEIELFHRLGYMAAELVNRRIEKARKKNEKAGGGLFLRLAHRMIRTDALLERGNATREEKERHITETQEVHVSLATSFDYIAARDRLQKQIQLLTDPRTFIEAIQGRKQRLQTGASVLKRIDLRGEVRGDYVCGYLETMIGAIIAGKHSHRIVSRPKNPYSTVRKALQKGVARNHDIFGLRVIAKVKTRGLSHDAIIEAEYTACKEIHDIIQSIARDPNNPYGLRERSGEFDNYYHPEEGKQKKASGWLSINNTFELVSGDGGASFPFELQFVGEETNIQNEMDKANHTLYEGIHVVDVKDARLTTSIFIRLPDGKLRIITQKSDGRLGDYFACLHPVMAFGAKDIQIEPAFTYGEPIRAAPKIFETIPHTGAQVSFGVSDELAGDQGHRQSLIDSCLFRKSKERLRKADAEMTSSDPGLSFKGPYAGNYEKANYLPERRGMSFRARQLPPALNII